MRFVVLLLLYVPSCSTFLHHPSSLRTPASRIVQRCPFQMQLPPPRHRRSDYPVRPPALSLGVLPKSSPGIQGDDAGPAPSGAKPGGDWVPLVFLAAVSVLICYADRSNLSDAIIPMTLQYGYDAPISPRSQYAYMHTYIHAYIHAYIHTYIHTYMKHTKHPNIHIQHENMLAHRAKSPNVSRTNSQPICRWSKTSEGAVLSSFFIGYALTQVCKKAKCLQTLLIYHPSA
jgi:hypothetical protein